MAPALAEVSVALATTVAWGLATTGLSLLLLLLLCSFFHRYVCLGRGGVGKKGGICLFPEGLPWIIVGSGEMPWVGRGGDCPCWRGMGSGELRAGGCSGWKEPERGQAERGRTVGQGTWGGPRRH